MEEKAKFLETALAELQAEYRALFLSKIEADSEWEKERASVKAAQSALDVSTATWETEHAEVERLSKQMEAFEEEKDLMVQQHYQLNVEFVEACEHRDALVADFADQGEQIERLHRTIYELEKTSSKEAETVARLEEELEEIKKVRFHERLQLKKDIEDLKQANNDLRNAIKKDRLERDQL